jgi:hypothetical protein
MINQVIKKYFNNKFINYQVFYNNGVTSTVPLDPANTDYQDIQEWIAKGGEVIDNGDNI